MQAVRTTHVLLSLEAARVFPATTFMAPSSTPPPWPWHHDPIHQSGSEAKKALNVLTHTFFLRSSLS